MEPEAANIFVRNQYSFHPVVHFDPEKDTFLKLDLTDKNADLAAGIVEDTDQFAAYINQILQQAGCRFAIGGYAEHRTVYARSKVFDGINPLDEPRRIHLGVDIWGPAGTPVFAPLGGMVHSFAFNDRFGDYGATLILLHQLDGVPFYTLYGHLSLNDISLLSEGQYLIRGEKIAQFGEPHENGHWPPHLHFQIIFDLGSYDGDFPGVCKFSEKEKYLNNCPDPDLILQLNRYMTR